eukprot:CAMPEP_0170513054 /NCGR_PEP_ID=MMETSP0208-20121228/67188_1 /TAXON_ID=197538 /ORGANISM="Strombidium inclinatum, Strain S3" /LENGTH=75 /DNA_ID=CAMNT_0010796745 /DNA_START=453 /DNA_END=683 /DNA_ORIENTATION=+
MAADPSADMYSQREAVSGKFVKTKKVNKLSNYYMDIMIKQKKLENEAKLLHAIYEGYRSQGAMPPMSLLDEFSQN